MNLFRQPALPTVNWRCRDRASTATDVVITVLTVALLAAFLYFQVLARPKARGPRMSCLSNLKQIGLGFRIWCNDSGDKFPWGYSTNDSGTAEYSSSEVFRHFQIASNQLADPRILICPADKQRTWQTDWSKLRNTNLSYFIGLNSYDGRPQTLLSGDRTITTNGTILSGFLTLSNPNNATWARGLHTNCGVIGLSDGSAQTVNDAGLQRQIEAANRDGATRLVIP
jgi:hypothetical protein